MKYRIEHDAAPPPKVRRGGFPFDKMTPGSAFTVPEEDANRARTAAHRYGKKTGRRIVSSTVPDGVRFWYLPENPDGGGAQ